MPENGSVLIPGMMPRGSAATFRSVFFMVIMGIRTSLTPILDTPGIKAEGKMSTHWKFLCEVQG